MAASLIYNNFTNPTKIVTTPPDIDPTDPVMAITDTPADIVDAQEPTRKISYTSQVAGDEICIINADGSIWRRLTNMPSGINYANPSPDGNFVLFVGRESGSTEIYEIDLNTDHVKQLTNLGVNVGAPEVSPDNQFIIFTYRPGDNNQLYVMGFNGREPRLINDTVATRGRSDWSLVNLPVFDMGGTFLHDVYAMNLDGSNLHKISNGNNTQGASFSPDGQWIALTAYTDVANKDQASCEVYIMRVDGSDMRQLISNHSCDYQPRWGIRVLQSSL